MSKRLKGTAALVCICYYPAVDLSDPTAGSGYIMPTLTTSYIFSKPSNCSNCCIHCVLYITYYTPDTGGPSLIMLSRYTMAIRIKVTIIAPIEGKVGRLTEGPQSLQQAV